nr:MAG TPA: hypothetical protein [Caudoviricetes sp.]
MKLVYKCIHNIQIKDTRNPPPPSATIHLFL